MRFLILLICLSISCLIVIINSRKKNHIGNIFNTYWLVNIVLGILAFNYSYSWNLFSLCFLLLCVFIFYLGYSFTMNNQARSFCTYNFQVVYNTEIAKKMLFFTVTSGLAYVYYELTSNGFGVGYLTSIDGLMETGAYFTDGRYGGNTEIQVSLLGQICLMINYSGFVLSGYSFKLNLTRKIFCFVQFIPMIFSTLATTAKTLLISGILLWVTGYMVANYVTKSDNIYNKIKVRNVVSVVIVLIFLFYLSFVIRYQDNSASVIINRLFVYTVGHVPCYDHWFDRFEINLFGYSYGQQSMQMFFGSQQSHMLASVYIPGRLDTVYGWTNVISMFAYTIMDFGYLGSLLYFLIFGIMTAYSQIAVYRCYSAIGHAFLSLSFYSIFYSFLINPLKYTSIVGCFCIFGIFVSLIKAKLK